MENYDAAHIRTRSHFSKYFRFTAFVTKPELKKKRSRA